MKKLVGFSIIIMLLSFSLSAQQNRGNFNKENEFTPEQQATLKSKKMALNFDLNANQQKEVYTLMLQNEMDRKTKRDAMKQNKLDGKEISSTEKFEMQSQMLDKQIQHKAAMKNILSKEQYEKWSKSMNKGMQVQKAKNKSQNKMGSGMQNGNPQNRQKKYKN